MDISLALGGGGARGYAHVGVIRRLEQEGYQIRAVAGTSAGGIVAGLYAAGRTANEMEALFADMDQSRLFGLSMGGTPSLLGLTGAEKLLEDNLDSCTFGDLRIPCAMAAVDIKSGQEVILKDGRLVDAILATIALPGIFPPKEIDGYQLVDGGVLDPVPVSVARSLAPELPVVAVILDPVKPPAAGFAPISLPVPVPAPIVERITRMRVAQAFNVFLQSVDVASRRLAEMRLREDDPDVIIRPDVGGIGLLDRVDVHKIVRLGEKASDAALPDLSRVTAWPHRMRRWLNHRVTRR